MKIKYVVEMEAEPSQYQEIVGAVDSLHGHYMNHLCGLFPQLQLRAGVEGWTPPVGAFHLEPSEPPVLSPSDEITLKREKQEIVRRDLEALATLWKTLCATPLGSGYPTTLSTFQKIKEKMEELVPKLEG